MKQYPFEGLNELSKQLHEFQVEAGFGEATEERRMMLIHSEISEAYEAFRNDEYADIQEYKDFNSDFQRDDFDKESFEAFIKDTFEDELIDTLIRLLAFLGEKNIDVEFHAENKMKYNHLRGYKFGGKKF